MSSPTESPPASPSAPKSWFGIYKAQAALKLDSLQNSIQFAQRNRDRWLKELTLPSEASEGTKGGASGEGMISVDSPVTTTNHYYPVPQAAPPSALSQLGKLAVAAGLGAGGLVAYEAWQSRKAAAPVEPPAAVDTDTDTNTLYDFGIFRPPGEQAK